MRSHPSHKNKSWRGWGTGHSGKILFRFAHHCVLACFPIRKEKLVNTSVLVGSCGHVFHCSRFVVTHPQQFRFYSGRQELVFLPVDEDGQSLRPRTTSSFAVVSELLGLHWQGNG